MLSFFEPLRYLTLEALIIRFLLALLCGGLIGFQRGIRKHPAGLRTYALVSIGAASVMVVSQYLEVALGNIGDLSRMGAQVISGIGFLGAGTVIVTGKSQVKGLSTAAGLWASACMGLAIGAGYYEAGILMCALIFAVLVGLNKIDENFIKTEININIFVEFDERLEFGSIVKVLKANELGINEIADIIKENGRNRSMIISLSGKDDSIGSVKMELNELEGIIYAEQI
ncbi:MAG: MgtC/SapB family protein [Lachnospiraceae bacterium]|nr:MgtC/SapB family protein [Lachnospiraceae bacterium]